MLDDLDQIGEYGDFILSTFSTPSDVVGYYKNRTGRLRELAIEFIKNKKGQTMPIKQPEETNKDRLMKIADNELRELIDKKEAERFIRWWLRWRTEVGWKRLSRLLTTYSKEFKIPCDPNSKKIETEDSGEINGNWSVEIGRKQWQRMKKY